MNFDSELPDEVRHALTNSTLTVQGNLKTAQRGFLDNYALYQFSSGYSKHGELVVSNHKPEVDSLGNTIKYLQRNIPNIQIVKQLVYLKFKMRREGYKNNILKIEYFRSSHSKLEV